MADVQRRPENVGRVLIQVQDDLKHLKDQLTKVSDPSLIDLHSLDDALHKTQEGIKRNTEYLVDVMNNEVSILPTVEDTPSRRSLRPLSKPQVDTSRPVLHSSVYHDSPGENFNRNLTMKALLNPESIYNRSTLHKNYGLPLPSIKQQSRNTKFSTKSLARGSTIESLSVLPKANRVNPLLAPPPILEKDARKGILSLIERGLIPPAAELTLDPSPVHHKKAPLHFLEEASRRQLLSESSARGENSHYMASVKLDMSRDELVSEASQRLGTSDRVVSPSTIPFSTTHSADALQDRKSPQLRSVLIRSPHSAKKSTSAKSSSAKSALRTSVYNVPLEPIPPPATPARKEEERMQVVAASKGYSFFIRSGVSPTLSDPEYAAFHQRYLLQWGNILSVQNRLQKVLRDYSISNAYVIGDKLAELAVNFELGPPPTREDLLSVLENQSEVSVLISTPGRRYMGSDASQVAATKIQSTWRRYRNRIAYLDYRRQKWAAGVIAIAWIMHVQLSRMRSRLREIRKRHVDNYRTRARTLGSEWKRIASSKRVIIHVPSLGYPGFIRSGMTNLSRLQNSQVGRLCDVSDPNVDVVYVSPIEILEDFSQYYKKLLGIRNAVDSGNPEDIGDLSSRFTLVVPDALSKFPTHNMCLASLLKYSPKTIKRIKRLIAGRDAIYVPWVVHRDDMAVADALGVPILGCEPDICHLYSSKSGTRRIFAAAGVPAPPGEHDVYTAQQLNEYLARLICDNPTVTRWLLKMDVGFHGRGTAYIDVEKHLPCYKWMLRESGRYGDRWSKRWAQDAAYTKILCELPDTLDNYMIPCNRAIYPTWVAFLDAFLSQGGIIDACPPSDSVTHITVTMLVEPDGCLKMTSCGDQIHAKNPLRSFGVSMPQDSIDPTVLTKACKKIGEACKARGVMGHFEIDFLTFIDHKMKQQLWASDLKLAYSGQMAMTQMCLFLTGGELDASLSKFQVPPPPKPKPGRFRKKDPVVEEAPILSRYCVLSTNLYHSNMAVVHYSVFFQMCRAHGIGFDIKERQGTIFTVVDAVKREEFGMLTVGIDLPGTLATFARNLTTIHDEISAPNMQGKTNFKSAVNDIEDILGITSQNEQDEETQNKKQSF